MRGERAGDQAGCAGTCAEFFDGLDSGAFERGIVGEAEVIVGGKVKVSFSFDLDFWRLRRINLLQLSVKVWDAARSALNSIEGTVLLLHSRKASDPTSINLTKLHPFCWPGKGKGIMFCQNGTIRKHERLKSSLGPGAIDTEKYFDIVIRHY